VGVFRHIIRALKISKEVRSTLFICQIQVLVVARFTAYALYKKGDVKLFLCLLQHWFKFTISLNGERLEFALIDGSVLYRSLLGLAS